MPECVFAGTLAVPVSPRLLGDLGFFFKKKTQYLTEIQFT